MIEDYESAVAAIRDARSRSHALTGSLRLHIEPIDEALRAKAVSVRRLAEDLGENYYSVRDAVYRLRHEASAPGSRTTKPAANPSTSARDSKPEQRPTRSVPPKPDTSLADDDDNDERPWIVNSDEPDVEQRLSKDGKYYERRDKKTKKFLGKRLKV